MAPELEDQDKRVIVAVVAHELAHVILGDVFDRECGAKADALIPIVFCAHRPPTGSSSATRALEKYSHLLDIHQLPFIAAVS